MLANDDRQERWVPQDGFVVKLWLVFAKLYCFGDKSIFSHLKVCIKNNKLLLYLIITNY